MPRLSKKVKSPVVRGRGVPMRTRIFLSFVLFSAVVLGLLWIFYSFFISELYRDVRTYETEKFADVLSGVPLDEVEGEAKLLAEKYSICVSVYRVQDMRGVAVSRVHVGRDCIIHSMVSENFLREMFTSLSEKDEDIHTVATPEKGLENIIYATLKRGDDGAEYMYLFNAELYPLSSTLSTLRLVLAIVSVMLIVIAAVMSVVLSSRLARPAAEMSREAAKLALGNYDVNFDGGGHLEMENLAAALNRASLELSRLDKMQKDLIANVSHDLRTPLTLISGYGEVMRDIPGEATAENLQVIIDETNRLAVLVEDMLDLSRMMSGAQNLSVSRFSLTEALRETVERYSRLSERDGYIIRFRCEEEVFVEADRKRILQVIYNLVSNAINYTGDDKTVVLTQRVRDGVCRVEVTDSGCGIPREELTLIWERYYKASEFHKRARVGTGLGLSIVKSILVLHGASFGVSSTVGKGSTFWFELPVSSSQA